MPGQPLTPIRLKGAILIVESVCCRSDRWGRKRRRQPVLPAGPRRVCVQLRRRAQGVAGEGLRSKTGVAAKPMAASTAGSTRQGRTSDPATTSAARAKPMAVVYESFDRVTLRWQFRRSVLASSGRVLGGGFVGGGGVRLEIGRGIEAERGGLFDPFVVLFGEHGAPTIRQSTDKSQMVAAAPKNAKPAVRPRMIAIRSTHSIGMWS